MLPFLTHAYSELSEDFYTLQEWQGFNNSKVVIENNILKNELGMQDIDQQELLKIFNGTKKIDSLKPLSMVYSGHQFGQYVEQLGDGRGLLLGQIYSEAGLLDLHLKGAGKTPYSRFGDGRAVLRSVIREYLCGEAMHALSIPTSRALMIVGSDEMVIREKSESAAMLARTAKTHIRFGNFEYFHYNNKPENVKALADFCINNYPNYFFQTPNSYEDFFKVMVKETANMIAHWQAFGFNHGVMNTDNMSILGDTIDYGPFGFLDTYDPGFICNHSDHQGRYSFQNQPSVALWNLNALATCFSSLLDTSEITDCLHQYENEYLSHYRQIMAKKLGLLEYTQSDESLINQLLVMMANDRVDYTLFFRKLCDFSEQNQSIRDYFIDRDKFDLWSMDYLLRVKAQDLGDEQRQQAMQQVNPAYVLRNYMAQDAIKAAENGDFSEVELLLTILKDPFVSRPEAEKYAGLPPDWASEITVSCSS